MSIAGDTKAVGRPQAGTPLIRFKDVQVTLGGNRILEGINLDINAGEFVCVIGPSGSGKTTLMRMIAGFVSATSGSVVYKDEPITKPRQDIAIVFQDYTKALLPWRNAADNVSLPLEAMKVPKDRRRQRSLELLTKTGLGKHGDKFPNQMSGGMQQRLQIARSLAQDPVVLLMDEPFGALDAMTRQTLQDEVLDIVGKEKITTFFVTHDLEEAVYLGDRVIGLLPSPGRIGRIFDVPIPRPRDQLTTREGDTYLHLRHQLYEFLKMAER